MAIKRNESTGEASEIWVVARIDLGRTRRDATRRAATPCRSLATLRRFFGYAVLLLSARTIYPSIRVVPFHSDLLTGTNPEVGEFSIKTLIDWSVNHLFHFTTKYVCRIISLFHKKKTSSNLMMKQLHRRINGFERMRQGNTCFRITR